MTRHRLLLLLSALLTAMFVATASPAHAAPNSPSLSVRQHAGVVDGFVLSPGCGSIFLISQVCRTTFGTVNDLVHGQVVKAAGDLLGGNGATAERLYHSASCATSPLDCMANATGDAAGAAFRWLWRNIDTATSIDLVPLFHPFAAGGQSLMDVTIEIAALVGLALFFAQIVMSALRAEPGGVGRAARGLLTAYVGSIIAILSIPLLDAAITQVCDGIVKTVTGTDLSGFGKTLAVAMSLGGLTGAGLPIVLILVGFAIIVSAVIIWAAVMIRKMLVVLAAIFAPLAFSGATADMTKNWMRRWIEVTLALLFSKLILVIIMTVGFMMMDGYGQHGGITNTLTNVCIGVLLLALGGFAPLMALKMVHFAGEGLHHLHAQAGAIRSNAQSVAATPQKVQGIAARMSWTARGGPGGAASAAGERQNRSAPRTSGSGGGSTVQPKPGVATGQHSSVRGGGGVATAGAATARGLVAAPRAAAATVDGAANGMRPPPAGTDRPPTAS